MLSFHNLQALEHPAGTSDNSDKCDTIESFWFCCFNGGLDMRIFFIILKCLKENRKCVSKITNYVGTFPQ